MSLDFLYLRRRRPGLGSEQPEVPTRRPHPGQGARSAQGPDRGDLQAGGGADPTPVESAAGKVPY